MSTKLFDLNLEEDELNIDKYFELKQQEEAKGDDNPQLIKEKEDLKETVDDTIKENEEKGIDTSSSDTATSTNDTENDTIDDDLDGFDDSMDDDVEEVDDEDKTKEDDKEKKDEVDEEKEEDKPSTESHIELSPYQQQLLINSNIAKVKQDLNKLLEFFSLKKETFNTLAKVFSDNNQFNYENKIFEDTLPGYINLASAMLTDKSACPLTNVSRLRDIYIQTFSKMKNVLEYGNKKALEILSDNTQTHDITSLRKDIIKLLGKSDMTEDMLPGGYNISYITRNVFTPSINMAITDLKDVSELSVDIPFNMEMNSIAKVALYVSTSLVNNLDTIKEEVSNILYLPEITEHNKELFIRLYVTYFRKTLMFLKAFISYLEVRLTEISDFFIRFKNHVDYINNQEQSGEVKVNA